MTTLQATAHFWTLRDDVVVSDCDLGVFKYHPNKEADLMVGSYGTLKRTLCESRDQIWILSNKKPTKLKDALTEVEDILAHQTVIHAEWMATSYGSGLLVFNNGIIVHLQFNSQTGDIHKVVVDRTLEAKLLSEVSGATISASIIVLAHTIPYLTVIQASQDIFGSANPSLLSQSNISVTGIQLPGPGTRRQERRVALSPNSNYICIWWQREGSELYAWAPVVKAEDRANILIYAAHSGDLVACHYTEHTPLAVEFSHEDANLLRVVQMVSTIKGRVTVIYMLFSIQQGLQQIQQKTLKLSAPPRSLSFSPDEQILLIGCVDAQLISWNIGRDSFASVKSAFIPFHVSWHRSSSMFTVASERGQIQCWDRSLNPILLRLRTSPVYREGSLVLHVQQYLRQQPSLFSMKWVAHVQQETENRDQNVAIPIKNSRIKSMRSARKKSRRSAPTQGGETKAPSECLMICFERGPVLCLRFLTGCWPTTCSLNALTLCSEYLIWRQYESAVQLLLSMNWVNIKTVEEEDVLLGCFSRIVHALLHQESPSGAASEKLLERTIVSLMDIVKDDGLLSGPIVDAARKTFRILSMRNRIESAAVYALKLRDADLLVELILHAQAAGVQTLVQEATTLLACVRESYSSCSSSDTGSSYTSCDGSSSGSHSSCCSTCDEDSQTGTETIQSQLSNTSLSDRNEDQVHIISFGEV